MKVPENLYYTEEHEWLRKEDGDIAFIGITDFAQGELDELVYIEVETVGETLERGEIFGSVEAVKTTSDLYMPVTGTILEFNAKLSQDGDDDPTLVNRDPYGEGWIVKIQMTHPQELTALKDAAGYEELIS